MLDRSSTDPRVQIRERERLEREAAQRAAIEENRRRMAAAEKGKRGGKSRDKNKNKNKKNSNENESKDGDITTTTTAQLSGRSDINSDDGDNNNNGNNDNSMIGNENGDMNMLDVGCEMEEVGKDGIVGKKRRFVDDLVGPYAATNAITRKWMNGEIDDEKFSELLDKLSGTGNNNNNNGNKGGNGGMAKKRQRRNGRRSSIVSVWFIFLFLLFFRCIFVFVVCLPVRYIHEVYNLF